MGKSGFIQIFAGGYRGPRASFYEVRTALERLPAELELSGVIMGWAPGKALYRETLAYLAAKGVPLYLWMPVFSETSILADCDPLINLEGEALRGPQTDEAENFEFCCPASRRNADNVYGIFKRHFADIGFNGVFLDKIRYPSPANRPWEWRVCFCPFCLQEYKRRELSADELRLASERLPQAAAPFTAVSYDGGRYRFADSAWERFFKAKSNMVAAAVKALSGRFREEGYRVGLDVFAPFLSPFVGQDLAALSGCCDWIKPMMYQNTYAPAGLPFETDALCRTGCANPADSWFTAMTGGGRKPPPAAFLRRELEMLLKLSACPVYPGLEVNRIPRIADITPENIKRWVELLPEDTPGVVLSWNMLKAPEDNIKAAARALRGT